MIRSLGLALVTTSLFAALAFADPQVRVRYELGAVVVQLEGDYAHHEYSVWRAERAEGPWTAVASPMLCIGPCAALDPSAEAGRTYFYRFDMVFPGGAQGAFGPYPVTISDEIRRRVAVTVGPNPVRDQARVSVRFARFGASPWDASVKLFDVQGRPVRTLYRGPVTQSGLDFTWNGRGDDERPVAPGLYFLRVETSAGVAIARVIRSR